jgi:hypothetical protein
MTDESRFALIERWTDPRMPVMTIWSPVPVSAWTGPDGGALVGDSSGWLVD